jgi:hypothetical protein
MPLLDNPLLVVVPLLVVPLLVVLPVVVPLLVVPPLVVLLLVVPLLVAPLLDPSSPPSLDPESDTLGGIHIPRKEQNSPALHAVPLQQGVSTAPHVPAPPSAPAS